MSKNIFAVLLLSVVGLSAQASNPNMMCTQALVPMFNQQTKEFKMARNSCEAADLRLVGFSDSTVIVEEPVVKPLLTVITKGQFKLADTALAVPCQEGKTCIPMSHAILANSKLVLSLPLVGCVDTAFVTYKISDDAETGVKTVLVSALNVRNEKSDSVRCIAPPMATKVIDLHASVMDKSSLKVEFVQEVAQ